MRPAVIVIDMLNDCFGHVELQRRRASLCASINELTRWARGRGYPVIWARQELEADLSDATLDMKSESIRMFVKGTSGPLLLDEVTRADSDMEIVKKRYSVFFGTDLDVLIQRLQVNELTLADVNAHACVRMSAIDSYQRDIPVTIVRECVASKDVSHHNMSLEYMDGGIATVVRFEELQKRFDQSTEQR